MKRLFIWGIALISVTSLAGPKRGISSNVDLVEISKALQRGKNCQIYRALSTYIETEVGNKHSVVKLLLETLEKRQSELDQCAATRGISKIDYGLLAEECTEAFEGWVMAHHEIRLAKEEIESSRGNLESAHLWMVRNCRGITPRKGENLRRPARVVF